MKKDPDSYPESACLVCAQPSRKLVYSSEIYPDGHMGNVYRCLSCGLYQRYPFEPLTHKHTRGETSIRHQSHPDPESVKKNELFEDLMNKAIDYRMLNRVLDVGSGRGEFLEMWQDAGWEAHGIEPVPILASAARERGCANIHTGHFEETHFRAESFDIVTLINILEHLPDPLDAIHKAGKLLRPGGRIYIRTPNANFHLIPKKLIARIYPVWKSIRRFDHFVMHTFSFSPRTIKYLFDKIGFINPLVSSSPSVTTGDPGHAFKRLIKSGVFYKPVIIMSFGYLYFCSSLFATADKADKASNSWC